MSLFDLPLFLLIDVLLTDLSFGNLVGKLWLSCAIPTRYPGDVSNKRTTKLGLKWGQQVKTSEVNLEI